MRPIITDVGEYIQAFGEVVPVVGRWMCFVIVRVVIPEDIVPALVAGVVRVLDGLSILRRVDFRDLKVLDHVDHHVSVPKEFPRDHTAL